MIRKLKFSWSESISALFIGFMFLFANISLAQQKIEVVKGGEVTLKSKPLKEERTISIHLPANYNFTDQKFPVLYLLDGKAHFNHAIGAVDFLVDRQLIPNLIIVAIHNIDRNRDFSPIHQERFPSSGGGEKFLKFVATELTPYVKNNFRASDFSVVMGHSFGGTIITYSLLTQPELFDGYISISPYLQYADNFVVKLAGEKLQPKYENQKHYYMTVGKEPTYFSPLAEFSSLVKEKSGNAIRFEYKKMEDENHTTIPYNSVFNGLRFIFADWQLPQNILDQGLVAMDTHYKKLSKKYGYVVAVPENAINMLGYTHLQKGEMEKAIAVFIENTKRYPFSANVYDSLGEAFETNKQLKEAKKNYKKAYDLAKEQDHYNTPIFLKNLNRVKERLKMTWKTEVE